MSRGLPSPIAALLVAVLALGCRTGPRWTEELDVPAFDAPPASRVVVSGFLQSLTDVSATGSSDVVVTRESVRTSDLSATIAAALRAEGVDAEARKGVGVADLGEDELLLSGSLLGSPVGITGKSYGHLALYVVTLGAIGLVLPSPFPWNTGQTIEYSVEIVDADGRYLTQVNNRSLNVVYDNWWTWPGLLGNPTDFIELVPPELAREVAPELR